MGTMTGWWFDEELIEHNRYVPAGTPSVTSAVTAPFTAAELTPLKNINLLGSVADVCVKDSMVSMTTCVCPTICPPELRVWGAAK